MTQPRLTSCDQHTINDLPYLAKAEDADRRMARGERQYRCAECGLWQWPEPRSRELPPDASTRKDQRHIGRSGASEDGHGA